VQFVNHLAIGEHVPNLTFVLDLDPDEARLRLKHRPCPPGEPDRMEQQPAEFYHAVRDGYLQLARREPERIRVIDASTSVTEIEAAIWSYVELLIENERAAVS
jgi:dTMP kinase